jgi:hypothetical protein
MALKKPFSDVAVSLPPFIRILDLVTHCRAAAEILLDPRSTALA